MLSQYASLFSFLNTIFTWSYKTKTKTFEFFGGIFFVLSICPFIIPAQRVAVGI